MAERQAQARWRSEDTSPHYAFQRLTVDIPHDRKRLRLCQSDGDPLEVEGASLGEHMSVPPNREPDEYSADEQQGSFAADFDMEPTRPAR